MRIGRFSARKIRGRLAANVLQQQARFDKFIDIFNSERPHEALAILSRQEKLNFSRALPDRPSASSLFVPSYG
jgi:hypothetical protein